MAKGDLHVEQKAGAWVIEEEGTTTRHRILVERLAGKDQAWQIALFYAKSAAVDAYLWMDRRTLKEEHFRPDPRKRRRR